MAWNQDKSVRLSRCCVWLFAAVGAAACLTAPWLFGQFVELRALDAGMMPLFLATAYLSALPAGCILWQLHRMLGRIADGAVFVPANVKSLRVLSWCCLAEALLCLVSALYYLPFLVVTAAAGFMGLILRVVKNAFAQAQAIKAENDYTI